MDVYSLPVPGAGGKTCSQIFEEAGCDTPASPSCGACLGGPKDTYARMNEAQANYYLFYRIIDLLLICYRVRCIRLLRVNISDLSVKNRMSFSIC